MPRDPADLSDSTLRLLTAPGVGPATIRRLREHFGEDDAIAAASVRDLTGIDGIGRASAEAICAALEDADPERERAAMVEAGVRLMQRGDEDFPALLAAIPDAPEVLWVRGEITDADRLAVGIVGSRRCTGYGREQAGRLSALLAQSGLTIVSGGAIGIDAEAHRGALRVNGRTIAVLGCGFNYCYPRQNADLFLRIVESGGALVSEYPMDVPPSAGNFPRRNRIISGLSVGVLIVEAAMRSGALITARLAAEDHGREVMALPGRVDSPASAGCHKLIQDGGAALVTSHADVLRQLDSSSQLVRGALETAGVAGAADRASLFDGNLTEGQASIVEVLTSSKGPLLMDQLAARTQRSMSELMADLTLLEIRGRVKRGGDGVRLVGKAEGGRRKDEG